MVSVIYRYVTLAQQCHIDLVSITVLSQLSWGWKGMCTPEAPGHLLTVKVVYRGIYLEANHFGS